MIPAPLAAVSSATGTFLVPPPGLHADPTAAWTFLAGCGLIMVVAIPVCIAVTARTRSALPVAVFLSAMTWLPFEAFVDTPMGVQYASNNPAIAYTMFGRHIPLAVAATGGLFFLGGYGVYQLFLRGASIRKLTVLLIALGVVDWLIEMLGSQFHVMQYYGHNYSRIFGLPLYAVFQNALLYVLLGWMILVLAPHLKGWRALLFLPVMPGTYIAYCFGCTWPAYIAVQASAPPLAAWPAFLACVAMNIAVPIMLLKSRPVMDLRTTAAQATEQPNPPVHHSAAPQRLASELSQA